MGFDKLLRVKHLSWHVVVRTAKHVNLRPRGKGRKLAVWQGVCSCAVFASTWRSGSEAGACW